MKKGDLSINVIVVAAIAMLILVIISVLVFRTGDGLIRNVSCDGLADNMNAECVPRNTCVSDYGGIVNSAARCDDQSGQRMQCCLLPSGE